MRKDESQGRTRADGVTQPLSHAQDRPAAASFRSILFDESDIGKDIDAQIAPECFSDLNFDQIVASVTAGHDEYNLQPFFYCPLPDVATIEYRHDVFRDLGNRVLFECIRSVSRNMRAVRQHLAQVDKLSYPLQKQSWFLDAVDIYRRVIVQLDRDLAPINLSSRGFLAFRRYVTSYRKGTEFVSLLAETEKLKADLSGIRYGLDIEGSRIKVERYSAEPDYGVEVLQTFAKFKEEAAKDYKFRFPSDPEMNHIEAAILDFVAKLYPKVFSSLEDYYSRHSNFLDDTILVFDREVQFYIAYLDYMARYRSAGLPFCYPFVTDRSKEVCGREVFDLALANRLIVEKAPVVTNDFFLNDPERIFVVSGPNQGGKTTFARTYGQLHYLAKVGCPVPGKEARLFLFDKMFTHFEKEEDIRNLSSKLEDDLLRIRRILEQSTPNSILIMNESFVSTTVVDALHLSKQVIQQIIQRDMLCVTVTFLDELASLGETTVSMTSVVDPENPAQRTFKIIRRPADGLAYAMAIAKKYRLTCESIRRRITP
ncbi:MAG: hypothetical protein WCE63_06755 [Acidobacteriaceae bacterium]